MEKSLTGYGTLEKGNCQRQLEPELTATVSEIERRNRMIRIAVNRWLAIENICVHFLVTCLKNMVTQK